MTRYDIWKTASPPEYDLDDCCEECEGYLVDGCNNDDCLCHWTKEQHKEAAGEARYEAMREEKGDG